MSYEDEEFPELESFRFESFLDDTTEDLITEKPVHGDAPNLDHQPINVGTQPSPEVPLRSSTGKWILRYLQDSADWRLPFDGDEPKLV